MLLLLPGPQEMGKSSCDLKNIKVLSCQQFSLEREVINVQATRSQDIFLALPYFYFCMWVAIVVAVVICCHEMLISI